MKKILFLVWIMVFGTFGANAQSAWDTALSQTLEEMIAGDAHPQYRRLQTVPLGTLFMEGGVFSPEMSMIVSAQIPPAVAQMRLTDMVDFIELEPCGFNAWGYGIPSDENAHDVGLIGDAIRLNLAFRQAGWTGTALNAQIVSLFRISHQPSWDAINQNLMNLNMILFQQYVAGVVPRPVVVINRPPGCGAGEVIVEFEYRDGLHDVWTIPEFYFRVCSKRLPEPWDVNSCHFWRPNQQVEAVAGKYRWQGRAASGQRVDGSFVFDVMADTGKIILPPR